MTEDPIGLSFEKFLGIEVSEEDMNKVSSYMGKNKSLAASVSYVVCEESDDLVPADYDETQLIGALMMRWSRQKIWGPVVSYTFLPSLIIIAEEHLRDGTVYSFEEFLPKRFQRAYQQAEHLADSLDPEGKKQREVENIVGVANQMIHDHEIVKRLQEVKDPLKLLNEATFSLALNSPENDMFDLDILLKSFNRFSHLYMAGRRRFLSEDLPHKSIFL